MESILLLRESEDDSLYMLKLTLGVLRALGSAWIKAATA
jgi:hypothetical protein